jgi:hypothetical protein
MAWFHERGFDVEDVDFVEHGLYQPLDGVLCSAIRTQTGHAKGAGGRGEDEVAAVFLGAEVWERELDYVEGAEEVGVELVAQVVVILIFAGAYYTC